MHFSCGSNGLLPIGFVHRGFGTRAAYGLQTASELFNKKNDRLDARREKADEKRANETDKEGRVITYSGRKDCLFLTQVRLTVTQRWMRGCVTSLIGL